MHSLQKRKVSYGLVLTQALGLTILTRIGLLAFQRSIGIDWDFHPDALYYTQHIQNIRTDGFTGLLNDKGLENAFFIVLGYMVALATFNAFDDPTTLIIANIIIACLTAQKLVNITNSDGENKLTIPVLFFALSPYLAHLSIHPLKDTLTIYLSVSLLLHVINRNLGRFVLFSVLLILTRSYLGVLTSAVLVIWWLLRNTNASKLKQIIALGTFFVLFYIFFKQQLTERISIEFDGRDFYANGFYLVPNTPEIRYFLGWMFNFLVPFPFAPKSAGEAGYFLHWLLVTIIVGACLKKSNLKLSNQAFGLVLASLFLISFILTTTPSAGPLVRYRLSSEIFLIVALYGGRQKPIGTKITQYTRTQTTMKS